MRLLSSLFHMPLSTQKILGHHNKIQIFSYKYFCKTGKTLQVEQPIDIVAHWTQHRTQLVTATLHTQVHRRRAVIAGTSNWHPTTPLVTLNTYIYLFMFHDITQTTHYTGRIARATMNNQQPRSSFARS
ncbi:hypothetical protein DERF_009851 [Dermatophagoides farinae]|uniref:Uncharacterized protein n=1 Tax=Dermatophagoides farinae TaxID=6954 RepID=A0A922HY41_DERFA|nr:hypothetical protein DERF_009851 [Dermatophagoides farinae]